MPPECPTILNEEVKGGVGGIDTTLTASTTILKIQMSESTQLHYKHTPTYCQRNDRITGNISVTLEVY